MTDHPRSEQPRAEGHWGPEGHPDFETLSAFLDGEAPEAALHVRGCSTCTTTVGRLRSLTAAVSRMADTPTDDRREAALAAALTELRPSTPSVATPSPTGEAPFARPTVLPTVSPPRGFGPRDRHRPAGAGIWVALGSLAALALAVVAAVGLFRPDSGGPNLASGPPPDAAEVRGAADQAAPAPPPRAPAAPAAGSTLAQVAGVDDLGEVPSAETLVARFTAVAAQRAGRGAESLQAGDLRPSSSTSVPPPCLAQASASGATDGGAFVYRAQGTSQGRPVVILGFSPPPGRPVTLLVVDPVDCRLLYSVDVP